MPRERNERRSSGGSRASAILAKINSDIRALNSSILIISQKMRYLVRNEKILGRNLLVLNKKLKEFEIKISNGSGTSAMPNETQGELAKLNSTMNNVSDQLAELRSRIEEISETYAKEEELKEMKFVVDAIDPLSFVTRKDVKEIIETEKKPRAKTKK